MAVVLAVRIRVPGEHDRTMTSWHFTVAILLTGGLSGGTADAHSGGLNGEGCHNNRKTGDYHCHRGASSAAPERRPEPRRAMGGNSYYPNCAAVRAAGAAPLRVGDPGYRSGLDRDRDGVACE